MNVLFDKAAFEKARTVKTEQNNDIQQNAAEGDESDGKVVRDTILNSIQSAKLGALSVDPEFLEFRALECEPQFTAEKKRKMNHKLKHVFCNFSVKIDEGSEDESSFLNLSETRLYIVIGLIAALVFLAILQAICTIYQTSSKSRNQKVTTIF